MEKNMKKLNQKEMEQVSGSLRTEYLNEEEFATYLLLKEAADKAWYPSEITAAWDRLFAFKIEMKNKYGDDIVSDEREAILKKPGLQSSLFRNSRTAHTSVYSGNFTAVRYCRRKNSREKPALSLPAVRYPTMILEETDARTRSSDAERPK